MLLKLSDFVFSRLSAGIFKNGFTLAEVLITLGIIGIVAAMTLPTIIQKQQEKVTVNRLKKTYSALSQAYLMISKDYGDPENWGMSANVDNEGNATPEGSLNVGNLFAKYMKITKNCGTEDGCWHIGNSYRLDGKVYGNTNNRRDIAKIKLADGTHVAFGGLSAQCDKVRGNTKPLSHVCSWIIVDVNGNGRPNTYGIDIFEFSLTKYNIIPYGTQEDTSNLNFDTNCKNASSASGNGCTAWVIYNENMDYRRCSDLAWGGKTKCK